ncbi:hypothetical protein PVL29_019670 [Vitis rotundifolia]|uniref:RED-like N-terminal domain-containing protein n=1 Tax=Vitis rotundifolia TaxID=103349 RepID=A0AA39DDU3_VITRO|nr:hypothetical protein PVL29_019670 [Vitis rotundifolia]
MELLDVDMAQQNRFSTDANCPVTVAHISKIVSPPMQTALSLMEQRVQKECMAGHLPTCLKGLDEALGGGIPFGVLIELFKKDDRNWVKEFPRNIPCGRNGKGEDADGKSRVSNEDQPLSFRTTTAKSVYLWIVKPQTVAKSNEMFLPGRTVFIFNMEGGFSSDILHRSKADCPVPEEIVTVSADGSVLD